MAQERSGYSGLVMLAVAIAAAVFASVCYGSGVFRGAEDLTLDGRFWINSVTPKPSLNYNLVVTRDGIRYFSGKDKVPRGATPAGIIFVDMPGSPEAGLARGDLATAIKILSLWGVKAILFADLVSGPSMREQDESLAEAIGGSRKVYLPVFCVTYKGASEYLYTGEGVLEVKEPWPAFTAGNAEIGHINAWPDPDGKMRRLPPVIRCKGKDLYQLGLRAGLDMLGIEDRSIELDPDGHALSVKMALEREIRIPLDEHNRLIIDWGGMEKRSVLRASFRDIVESYRLALYGLRPLVDPKAFKDRICILGTEASNAVTGRPARVEEGTASSAACAMILNSLLQQSFVSEPGRSLNIAVIFLVSILFGGSLVNIRVLRMMMVAVIGVAIFSVASIYGVPKATAFVAMICISVPLGVFLARFHLFSGLLFTISAGICYLIVSAGLFKLFKFAIVTFYPVLAIALIFTGFYAYARLKDYLSNAKLFNMATRDGLTGLYNRRHLNLLLDAELGSAILHKARKLSVIMCDIDNFKKLNDTHGHQAGDAILREFARIMRAKCRQSDIVARYGGEEFMIVLHGAGSKDALKVAETIRQAVEEKKFTFKDQPYSTSLSMGLAEFVNEKTKEELIEKADQALYRAKKEGKNRVCVAE